jgi:four helix bundle protein
LKLEACGLRPIKDRIPIALMKDFKKLLIWSRGMDIAQESYKIVSSWPSFEKFTLGNQIIRAAISIPSNVAEGNSRNSEKDKKRFIEIALGSAYELETQIMISQNINIGDNNILENLVIKIREEQKLMSCFINKLSE